jgi:23S rRNA pseudouridine2605 synthase
MTIQRLSKILAACGVASRRKCEELIFGGKVTVNGEKILVPQTRVDPLRDCLVVNGQIVHLQNEKAYYMLNKPTGLLCTSKESGGEKSVLSLFDDTLRLFTVGRLDKETSGLIFVTNDGHFANAVIHPSKNISKEYLAKTDKELTDIHLKALTSGGLVEGTWIKPLNVAKVRKGTLKISVGEGKKREVRALLEYVGLKVLALKRIRIGSITLGSLNEGSYRPLTESEKNEFINKSCQLQSLN